MSTQDHLSYSGSVAQRPWDARLARLSGKSTRIGHVYDLAGDAAVTILLFIARCAMCCAKAAGPLKSPM